ncbi:TetR/AcrR family transcriptional regulator [Cohnella panacarvi]|uniref:TetR/AcrR family transcriptional regulator n=1 Tax=Cohnella panacarvi TaxID=400776 RepID=UPI00047876DA|nr:TetR/AcrR family transcriptional regulator [Cohnella panacarvi]
MNGFERRTSQIKDKILHTTLRMLRTSDPKRLRIADVAKEAGVSQVTIYNYFGSKEALIREAFIAYFDQAIRDFETYLNEGHSLREKIERIIYMKTTYSDYSPSLIKQLLHDDIELARHIEVLYREVSVPLMIRIIREGQATGEISPDVSIENALVFMQLYMNQYELLLEMADKSEDRDTFFGKMAEMFFYGLCGRR